MQTGKHRQFSVRLMLWTAILPVVVLTLSVMTAEAEYKGKYPYKVGTTVGMIADIVKEVVGDKGEVTNIIGTGVDPHLLIRLAAMLRFCSNRTSYFMPVFCWKDKCRTFSLKFRADAPYMQSRSC